jgi:XTP/dITP diphosphohydrolase
MMELVFASNNAHKIKEIEQILPDSINVLSLKNVGCEEDIPETADTIEGNAILKAEYVARCYNYPAFADDTGLEVDALGGAPGVYSARYAGDHKDADANMDKLLKALDGKTNRKARFKTVIALQYKSKIHTFTGIVEGEIITEKRGTRGFGYDPVFVPEGSDRTFAEMSMEEKAKISHRGRAVEKLIAFLKEI